MFKIIFFILGFVSSLMCQIIIKTNSVKFELTKPDTTKPVILVLQPSVTTGQEYPTKEKNLNLKFKVTDDKKLAKVSFNSEVMTIPSGFIFEKTLILTNGKTNFLIEASDESGNENSFGFSVNLTIDKIPPVITFNNKDIINNANINTQLKNFILEGIVTDNEAVYSFFVNDSSVKLDNGRFKKEFSLNEGINLFRVKAIDSEDNTTELNFKINYTPDHIPPIITISMNDADNIGTVPNKVVNKYDTLKTSKKQFSFIGKVTDTDGIKLVTINNENIELTKNEFSFNLPLQNGRNAINITATDSAENLSEFRFFIEYTLSKPKITIKEPKDSITVKDASITVTILVDDEYGIEFVQINGKNADKSADNEYFANIKLQPGANQIIINVKNKENLFSEKILNINRFVDEKGPIIKLRNDENLFATFINSEFDVYPLGGKIFDTCGIASLKVDNAPVKINPDGSFDYTLNLKDYANIIKTIKIVAMDKCGNSTSDSFEILFDNIGPIIKITKIDNKDTIIYITDSDSMLMKGTGVALKIELKTIECTVEGKATDVSGVDSVTVTNISSKTTKKITYLPAESTFKFTVKLNFGNNLFVIKAFDKKRNESRSDTLNLVHFRPDPNISSKYYALIIGINSYSGVWPILKNAVNDARDIEEVLLKKYKMDYVINLRNSVASYDSISNTLRWLQQNLTEKDNLLIYYSGHGAKDNLDGYWVPMDAKWKDDSKLIHNSIIKQFLGAIRTKHILLINDCCFSGKFSENKGLSEIGSMEFEDQYREYLKLDTLKSRIIITAGDGKVGDGTSEDSNSVFSYYLIKSLNNNEKQFLSADELFFSFNEDVELKTNNNPDQKPKKGRLTEQGDAGGEYIFRKKIEDRFVDNAGPVIKITKIVNKDTIINITDSDSMLMRGTGVALKIELKTIECTVEGKATDVSGVDSVTVTNISSKTTKKATYLPSDSTFKFTVKLNFGNNLFIIKAFDKKRNESRSDTLNLVHFRPDPNISSKYYALIIGINSYRNDSGSVYQPLKYAANDAIDMAEVLLKKYKIDSLIVLIDNAATKTNIYAKLEWFRTYLSENDNLLIYYSGHGEKIKDQRDGAWIAVDYLDSLPDRKLNYRELSDSLKNIKAKHILLINDCCFSGSFGSTKGPMEIENANPEELYEQVVKLDSKKSRTVITSGDGRVNDGNSELGNSVFSYYLIESLKNNKEQFITANKLYFLFKDTVEKITRDKGQYPVCKPLELQGDAGGEFIFRKKIE